MIPNTIVAAVGGTDGQDGGIIGAIVFVVVVGAVIYLAGRYKFGWWGPNKKD